MAESPSTGRDLARALDDLVDRVRHVARAVVLSSDGLLVASSRGLTHVDAERLAAVAATFHSLAQGTGRHLGGGNVRQTIIELDTAFFLITAVGTGACLAVQASSEADLGQVAYEMALLAASAGSCLRPPPRRLPGPRQPAATNGTGGPAPNPDLPPNPER